MKNKTTLLTFILTILISAPLPAHATGIFLTFFGLKDQEPVQNFYNGGTGGFGSTRGLNYGITFSSNTLAVKSYLDGGSGGFVKPPYGSGSAIFFSGTTPGVMNVAAGFSNGIQFFYAAGASATVTVWSGANGTGTVLATITLTANSGSSAGCSGFPAYCNWTAIGTTFAGTAKSVTFNGPTNLFGVADLSVGNSRTAIPEPSSLLLMGTGLVGLYGGFRSRLSRLRNSVLRAE